MFIMNQYIKALILCIVCLALFAGAMVGLGYAQGATPQYVPGIWRGDVHRPSPDLSGLKPLRIVTEADYPPFNYYDEDGTLTGFNVELIQAMCDVLGVDCTIEARDWETLMPSLSRKQSDIVAASISITRDSLKTADFTDRYYETPARFIAKKSGDFSDIRPEALKGKLLGVVDGSSHHAYLLEYYKNVKLALAKNRDDLHQKLLEGSVELIFDDGISTVFWLNGTSSKACCAFQGGPMIDQKYFGNGVGFAVQKGNRRLRELLDYALEKVRRDGIYEELFLRYFPISFY